MSKIWYHITAYMGVFLPADGRVIGVETFYHSLFLPTDGRVIGVETFYHTLNKIWHEQDQGETTVMNGEWSQRDRREVHRKSRRQLVQVVR